MPAHRCGIVHVAPQDCKIDGFINMDKNERPYHRHLFTVRLWREELGTGQAEWRGQVQYANDGDRRAFQDWPDLVAFLVAKLQKIKDDEDA